MRSSDTVRPDPAIPRVAAAAGLTLAVALVLQVLRAAPSASPNGFDQVRDLLGYLGESAAPYVLVPCAVGALVRRPVAAALGGVVSCGVLVAAYYGWFIPGSMVADRGGAGERLFWLVAAIGAGSCGGLLGSAAVRSLAWRSVIPAALVLEPAAWFVLLRLGIAPVLAQPQDLVGAAVEAAIGLSWLVAITARASGRARPSRRSLDEPKSGSQPSTAASSTRTP